MSGHTEIYVCQPGQDVKDGKLEYSETITSRAAAMADAALRTKADSRIAVIAYYAVDDSGHVEELYMFEASAAKQTAPGGKRSGAGVPSGKQKKKKAAPKKSFFGKLRAVFEA